MKFRVQFTVVMFAVLALGVPSRAAQPPQGRNDLPALSALIERAQARGEVRVIVGARTPVVPEGTLTAAQAVLQRAAIARAQASVITQLAGFPATVIRQFPSIPFFVARMGRPALERLGSIAEVQSIEEDVAERPLLAESTGLIRADEAWQSGYTGAGWTVAVLDTGVDASHPFLAGTVVSQACYSNAGGDGGGTSLCPGGAPVSNAAGSGLNCPSIFDGCEHGTHVAGITAGHRYTGGPAMDGVARGARIISVQVFTGFDSTECGGAPCVQSFVSDQISGLQRVYELRDTFHIAAVNMSLGGFEYASQVFCDSGNAARKSSIDLLRSVGIATIAASGNGGVTNGLSAPACISTAISVGSVDDGSLGTTADRVSPFSDDASFLTLLAPGRWINSSVPGGGFSNFSGTSMAAPHVAGAWALLRQRKPLATVSEVLAALTATGRPVADSRPGGTTHPRINVASAIPTIRVDYMALDRPASNTTVARPFLVSGWALNMSAPLGAGTGVDTVHVWAFPATGAPIPVGVANYGSSPRIDVEAAYGAQFRNSPWFVSSGTLPAGVYTIAAYARNTFNGEFTQFATSTNVTVLPGARVQIDGPHENQPVGQPFTIDGWAVDVSAANGTGIDDVHIWAYRNPGSGEPPVFLGQARYGTRRDDLGRLFGSDFRDSGFDLAVPALPGGRYLIAVYGHSTATHTFSALSTVTVDVVPTSIAIDTPGAATLIEHAAQPFEISGWAIDPASTSGAGIEAIHVWMYTDPGIFQPAAFVGLANIGRPRPDVGRLLGPQFTNSGFRIDVGPLPAGHTYRFALYARSARTGEFTVRYVDVTIR